MHELKQLVHDCLQKLPVIAQEAWVLAHHIPERTYATVIYGPYRVGTLPPHHTVRKATALPRSRAACPVLFA